MHDWIVIWDWATFAVRWLHVVAAIAWVGSSFYFIALDLGLRKVPEPSGGAHGEEWQVHGGGFYHVRKYQTAPEGLPDHLTWFKWESYATWLSGAALLMIVYWAGGDLFLLDPDRASLTLWQAIPISAASIVVGWLLYDFMCRTGLGKRPAIMMIALFAVIVAMSWGLNQVFAGRAALLHLGAFAATIMTGNVFFVIIPNQRVVVQDLREGRDPDPELGRAAKLRSTHNNYLALPVVLLMLSNHHPLAFAGNYAWIIASLTFPMGVAIRHFFNTMHARRGHPYWTWAVAAVLFILIAWLSSSPMHGDVEETGARDLAPAERKFVSAEGFDEVYVVVAGNCSMCHAREPVWDGLRWPPGGVVLETEADVARHARQIFLQAGASRAMPPPNAAAAMDAESRASIVAWYRDATRRDAGGNPSR